MGFTSPPNPALYYQQVWALVRQIPAGKVASYGMIAALIPPPPNIRLEDYRAWGARWVGGAMARCPKDVPWQRVVNSQGKISLPRGGPYERQQGLLQEEGVVFGPNGRIDLLRFGWEGLELSETTGNP
jgi:methylated-DNA-protein-cysteine methyltransferase-like protein